MKNDFYQDTSDPKRGEEELEKLIQESGGFQYDSIENIHKNKQKEKNEKKELDDLLRSHAGLPGKGIIIDGLEKKEKNKNRMVIRVNTKNGSTQFYDYHSKNVLPSQYVVHVSDKAQSKEDLLSPSENTKPVEEKEFSQYNTTHFPQTILRDENNVVITNKTFIKNVILLFKRFIPNIFYIKRSFNKIYIYFLNLSKSFFKKQNSKPSFLTFLILLLLICSPFLFSRSIIKGLRDYDALKIFTQNTIRSLSSAFSFLQSSDYSSFQSSLFQAQMNLRLASDTLESYNNIFLEASKNIPVAGDTVVAGEILLQIGTEFSKTASTLSHLMVNFELSSQEYPITQHIQKAREEIQNAINQIRIAVDRMEDIHESSLPESFQKSYISIHENMPLLQKYLEKLDKILLISLDLLGHYEKKKYLFLFQNNNELRATGGFIGSIAFVSLDKGKIEDIDVPGGGAYDTKGQLTTRIFSPKPLRLIAPRWYLWDANWWPDFPTSAEKIMWFYEKSGGETVDGVFAMNASLIVDLLKITGPIEMSEYNKVLNSENFIQETQQAVEIDYDKELNQPKKFIADLTPRLLEKVMHLKQEKLFEAMTLLNTAFINRDLQVYSKTEKVSNTLSDLGWNGEIKETDGDYLMVVDSNIGGGKSDAAISTRIDQKVHIENDGRIITTVTIEKKHNGGNHNILSDYNNVDYIRLYVPLKSKLLSVEGAQIPHKDIFKNYDHFALQEDLDIEAIEKNSIQDTVSQTDISEQFGKQVFGNWVQTSPFGSSKIVFRYELPFRADDLIKNLGLEYSLYIQKQSGVSNVQYQGEILNEMSFGDPLWSGNTDNFQVEYAGSGRYLLKANIEKDLYFSSVFSSKNE